MNRDMVEKSLVLPFLKRFKEEAGDPKRSDFVARIFLVFESSVRLEFDGGRLVNPHFRSHGWFDNRFELIRRLYPGHFKSQTRKYHLQDEKVLKEEFPTLYDESERDRRRHKKNSRNIPFIVISPKAKPDGSVGFAIEHKEGPVPDLKDLSWVEKLGFAKYRKDHATGFTKISNEILKRQKEKSESIDQLLSGARKAVR